MIKYQGGLIIYRHNAKSLTKFLKIIIYRHLPVILELIVFLSYEFNIENSFQLTCFW